MKKNIGIIVIIALLLTSFSASAYFYVQAHEAKRQVESLSGEREELQSQKAELAEEIGTLTQQLEEANNKSSNPQTTKTNGTADKKDTNTQGTANSNTTGTTSGEKVVYLTFDDGPSNLTPEVLDLLDQYHAKATFFVVHSNDDSYKTYLSEIVKRGHTLALHSYSHDYGKIYASADAFLKDFTQLDDWVAEETGLHPKLYRFPGGSTKGGKSMVNAIIGNMTAKGYQYYDWNVSSGDGNAKTTTLDIIANVCDNVKSHSEPVVLMHDSAGKGNTLAALPTILRNLSAEGYTFSSLNETMKPVQFNH
ncbi:hypothetical protein FACS1894111_13250 [Clostridia bacterium]|nr:hypothetical protein FACS1894111_13250 [Clostridia bacterium]